MMNTGTHGIDCQFCLLGDPKALWVMGGVERKTDHHIFGHRVEDRCCGLIGYENGATGVIENELSGNYMVGATVYGTDGMMVVSDNSLRYLTAKAAGWQEFEPEEQARGGYGDAFTDQANGIVDWIEGKVDSYRNTGEVGKATLEVMMAVYESARMHERVDLPLKTRDNPLDVAVEEGRIPVERPGVWDERSFLVRGESMTWIADQRAGR
jgi:predicted dehydrogenase